MPVGKESPRGTQERSSAEITPESAAIGRMGGAYLICTYTWIFISVQPADAPPPRFSYTLAETGCPFLRCTMQYIPFGRAKPAFSGSTWSRSLACLEHSEGLARALSRPVELEGALGQGRVRHREPPREEARAVLHDLLSCREGREASRRRRASPRGTSTSKTSSNSAVLRKLLDAQHKTIAGFDSWGPTRQECC